MNKTSSDDPLSSFVPPHPGNMLKQGFIASYNLKIETISDMLGISRSHLSKILNGHHPITHSLAIKLEILTGFSARKWMALQEEYNLHHLERNPDYQQYKQAGEEWRQNLMNNNLEALGEIAERVSLLAKKGFWKEAS